MKDETYVFISDVKEKGSIGRSARNRKTHAGKGGRVRLPSDNLSKKELQKMNGECKSFRLNEPMSWQEFKAMPDDIKITYIKLLREKYDVPDCELCKMFGKDKDTIYRYFKKLNLRVPRKNVHRNWKKEEWFAWVNGVEELPTPVIEEEPIQEPVITSVEPEEFVEEDLPFEEPDPIMDEKILTGIHPSQAELLKAELDKAKAESDWLRKECDSLRMNARILEAQMEVVRMIFGGANR